VNIRDLVCSVSVEKSLTPHASILVNTRWHTMDTTTTFRRRQHRFVVHENTVMAFQVLAMACIQHPVSRSNASLRLLTWHIPCSYPFSKQSQCGTLSCEQVRQIDRHGPSSASPGRQRDTIEAVDGDRRRRYSQKKPSAPMAASAFRSLMSSI
jgi:hypothetical protein